MDSSDEEFDLNDSLNESSDDWTSDEEFLPSDVENSPPRLNQPSVATTTERMVRNYVKKRAPYDEEAMQNAIKAVESGAMEYLKAANTFGVKRETLRDQVRKRYQKMGPGRDTYLSAAEERESEECLKLMTSWGFGFSQTEVLKPSW